MSEKEKESINEGVPSAEFYTTSTEDNFEFKAGTGDKATGTGLYDGAKGDGFQKVNLTKMKDEELKVYLEETNERMSDLLKDTRELEDSQRKQEVLVKQIEEVDRKNKEVVDRLDDKMEAEISAESLKITELTTELDSLDIDLKDKRVTTQELFNRELGTEMEFVESEEGQALLEKMTIGSIKSNYLKIKSDIEELLNDRAVLMVNPWQEEEFAGVADKLNTKYGYSNVNSEAVDFKQDLKEAVDSGLKTTPLEPIGRQ